MKNKITTFLFVLSSIFSFSQCPPILDQSHVTTYSASNATDHWQSFTAGASGDLSKISVYSNGGINATLTLGIYSGTGIGGTLLYTENKLFNLTGAPIELIWNIDCATMPTITNGSTYTIRIQGNLDARYNATNPYGGGYYYNNVLGTLTGADMNFKTFVSNPNKPIATLTSTNITCNGGNDGSIISSIVNGTPGYTFSWTGGGSTANITGQTAGTYTLNVTDYNTCASCPVSGTLTEPPVIFISAGADQTICSGDSAFINPTSANASTFSWSPSSGLSSINTLNTIASPTSITTYTITATDLLGCYMTDNITVIVNSLPNVIAPVNYQLCDGSPTTLSATGTAATYTWDNGVSDNVSFTPSIGSLNYVVTGIDGNNCINKDTVNVSVFANPNVTLIGIPNFCSNETTYALSEGLPAGGNYTGSGITSNVLDPTTALIGSNLITYSFTDGNGCSGTNSQAVTIYSAPNVTLSTLSNFCNNQQAYNLAEGLPTGGIYSGAPVTSGILYPNQGNIGINSIGYVYTDVNNCKDSAFQNITIFSASIITTPADQTICEGDEVILFGTGAENYLWDNGVNDNVPFIPIVGTVTYTAIGEDVNGCKDTSQTVITVNSLPVLTVSSNQIFCMGDVIELTAFGADDYNWENGDGIINTYSVSPTGTVDISVIGSTLGCNSEKFITLKLDDPNNVSAGEDVSICTGFGTNLNASGGAEYSWFGPNDFNANKQDSYVLIDSSAYYYVEIVTNDGCVYTDSIFVTALVGSNCSIDFSNTITPNNDGVNDTWAIEGIESFPENTVTIFNRWGDAVFEEDNYDNNNVKWDGINTLGNETVNGTYFYTIELKNGPTYSGWIELIK